MAGPPADFEPSKLWLKLQEQPRPTEVFDFPRKDGSGKPMGQVRIQVLTHLQQDEARERAQQYLLTRRGYKKEDLKVGLNEEILGDAVAREALALACHTVESLAGTDPPRYGRMFPTGEAIGQVLTGDEIATLFQQYQWVQHKYGPMQHETTAEEELDWIRTLATGAGAFPLAHMSWLQLAELNTSLARRSYTLSEIFESLYSSLPDTLKSRLESLNIGTGYFGEQLATDGETAPQTTGEQEKDPTTLTLEDAAAIAKKLHR